MASTDEMLRELLDRREIEELIYKLAELIDSFQLERMVEEIYAPDGSDDHGGGPVVGRQAVLDWYRDSTANIAAVSHNMCNLIIDLDGDRAEVKSNVISWSWVMSNNDAGPMRPADYALSLSYRDKVSRYPEGWRVDERVLVSNVNKTGEPMLMAMGALPQTQSGIQALSKRPSQSVEG